MSRTLETSPGGLPAAKFQVTGNEKLVPEVITPAGRVLFWHWNEASPVEQPIIFVISVVA
jgi:hypothetical protein